MTIEERVETRSDEYATVAECTTVTPALAETVNRTVCCTLTTVDRLQNGCVRAVGRSGGRGPHLAGGRAGLSRKSPRLSRRTAGGLLHMSHVAEAAVVQLAGHRNGRGGTVTVLGQDQVGLSCAR